MYILTIKSQATKGITLFYKNDGAFTPCLEEAESIGEIAMHQLVATQKRFPSFLKLKATFYNENDKALIKMEEENYAIIQKHMDQNIKLSF